MKMLDICTSAHVPWCRVDIVILEVLPGWHACSGPCSSGHYLRRARRRCSATTASTGHMLRREQPTKILNFEIILPPHTHGWGKRQYPCKLLVQTHDSKETPWKIKDGPDVLFTSSAHSHLSVNKNKSGFRPLSSMVMWMLYIPYITKTEILTPFLVCQWLRNYQKEEDIQTNVFCPPSLLFCFPFDLYSFFLPT